MREDENSTTRDDEAMSEDRQWCVFSISLAMRGMEDEMLPEYSTADLKELNDHAC